MKDMYILKGKYFDGRTMYITRIFPSPLNVFDINEAQLFECEFAAAEYLERNSNFYPNMQIIPVDVTVVEKQL